LINALFLFKYYFKIGFIFGELVFFFSILTVLFRSLVVKPAAFYFLTSHFTHFVLNKNYIKLSGKIFIIPIFLPVSQ